MAVVAPLRISSSVAASVLLFAAVIVVPVVGHARLRWSPILSFWFAYVVTRPLGASLADWAAKPTRSHGLGLGAGPVSLGLAIAIALVVAYLARTRRDVQAARRADAAAAVLDAP